MTTAAINTILCDTDLLSEIAGLRLGLLEQLHVLGRRQLELIEQGDMTLLIQVLAAKHNVLAELQQVEKRLDPFRGQNAEMRRWRSESLRRQCADVVGKSDQVFRAILEQEKLAETRLAHHRDETARRLQTAHAAGHARTAYSHPTARPGILDLKTKD
ncbi:MAG: hypothetical protein ACREHD_04290 [Pirellulales bacterium]